MEIGCICIALLIPKERLLIFIYVKIEKYNLIKRIQHPLGLSLYNRIPLEIFRFFSTSTMFTPEQEKASLLKRIPFPPPMFLR